jgi:hypothetical protein
VLRLHHHVQPYRIDARKGLELFQLSDHLPLAKEVLQEVSGTPTENEILKRLTRRRRRLVNERVRVVNNHPWSRLLTEPRILVREYGTIPVDPLEREP